MSAPRERTVAVNGCDCRIQEAGAGRPLVYLAGPLGVPRWSAFLELLARERRVIVPSLPGFPGATGHDRLDHPYDWLSAVLDLFDALELERADWIGASLGGSLAIEVASAARALVERLVLIAPLGIFADDEPVADLWAQSPGAPSLLSNRPDALAEHLRCPAGADPAEWQIVLARAQEASARLLWPNCDLGTDKRLHRVRARTLILWGSADRWLAPSYAKRFAERLGGPAAIETIEGAGHLADLDRPDACAKAVLAFLQQP